MDKTEEVTGVTGKRKRPLNIDDCTTGQVDETPFHDNYLSEQHQRTLAKCVAQAIEGTNNSYTGINMDVDGDPSLVLEAYERLSPITQQIETIRHNVEELSERSIRCSHQISALTEQLNELETTKALETSSIDAMSLNTGVLRQETSNWNEQIENEYGTVTQNSDGIIVWKVSNVREKTYDAKSERQTSVYSHAFYTSSCGYKVCIRLYLNGDGTAHGTHLSVFLVIVRGKYDALLEWPFAGRVCFCLCDQRTMIESNGTQQPRHVIECFRPDKNSVSFERPHFAVNIAAGLPKFFPLAEFNRPSNENLYVVNDTIFIKALIDFSNVTQTMLPFICNVDLALPAHIRQKLIAEEIKRRQELKNS